MIYDMCVLTVQGAFGGKEKLKATFPKECEILDIVDLSPLWNVFSNVPYIIARRFKVFYRYDKDNPPCFVKGGK